MDVRLTTLTVNELSELHDGMRQAAQWFRVLGKYQAAATAKAVSAECSQILLRREADHRQHVARQLSLTPPGAYDHL